MWLQFDPEPIDRFKAQIQQIPGYPVGALLPIREMIFASDAFAQLPRLLGVAGAAPQRPLFVVLDRTAMRRGADSLKPTLLALLHSAGWHPRPIWLEPDQTGQVHTDMRHIAHVQAQLTPDCAVLSVGAGTVTDIAKHACYCYANEHGIAPLPFVVYQTANSVSAYTSNMAPVFVGGVKRTLPSRYPDVLVCDLETLRDAPQAMTIAGVGDLLAACSSYADWYLAGELGLDPTVTPFAPILMGPIEAILHSHAAEFRAPTLDGMAILARLISLAGIAMSLTASTAPLSGFEHVISHTLDLLAERAGRPLAQHGTQVALATILATAAYEAFIAQFDPAQIDLAHAYPAPAQMEAHIRRTFAPIDPSGQVAAECWADYRLKLERWHEQRTAFERFRADWPAARARLRALARPSAFVAQIFAAVGGPTDFSDLDPPIAASDVKFAFLNAALMRRRFTLGDLLIFSGWDREALWDRIS